MYEIRNGMYEFSLYMPFDNFDVLSNLFPNDKTYIFIYSWFP